MFGLPKTRSRRPPFFQNADYASKSCRSATDNVTGLPIGDVTSSVLLGDSAPHFEDCALDSKSAAAFAASNVSAVPLAIRSSRLLPALALRRADRTPNIYGITVGSFADPNFPRHPSRCRER
jgi:hypothetical protein